MAQHDYNIANQTFPSFRTDLNNALSAIQTTNSGTSRPTGAVAGQIWLDTTSATTPTLKFYDGADDISLATIDYTANTVNWLDSTVSITGLSSTATGTVLTLTDTANTTTQNLIIDNQKEIRFRETTANGTNYIGLKAPASLTVDKTYILPSADGTSGQVLSTDGSGNLSWASSASTGNQFAVTVSGTITKGDVVALNSDATVFAPSGTDYASLTSGATLQDFAPTSATIALNINSVICSNSTGSLLLQAYPASTGNDIAFVAGTVSSGVVTWGTPLVVTGITLQDSSAINLTFDVTSGNFVAYYFGSSNTLTVRTISVSGTTCTANTAVTLGTTDSDVKSLPAYYDSTAGKHVVLTHSSSTQYPTAVVVSVSGTTVSLATGVVITSTASRTAQIYSHCFYDSTLNKGIFLFTNASSAISIALGTISAGVISFGTVLSTGLTLTSFGMDHKTSPVPFVTYNSDQSRVLMCYLASGSGTIYSYTVSGTTLTASTTYSITSSNSALYSVYYLSSKKILILFGSSGIVDYWYWNSGASTYVKDNITTNSLGTVSTTYGSGQGSFFGQVFYFTSNQRFGFLQSNYNTQSTGCPATTYYQYKTLFSIIDVPTTNLFSNSSTTYPIIIGLARTASYSNGNTSTIGAITSGNYTHGSAIFTFNTTYYKGYGGTFTTSSTATITNAGSALSTTVLAPTVNYQVGN